MTSEPPATSDPQLTPEPDIVDDDALDESDELTSERSGAGLTWAGDGALSPKRAAVRSALGEDLEIYPPALEPGADGYPLATFNRRMGGFILDTIVIAAAAFVVTILVGVPESADAGATVQSVVITTLMRLGYGAIFNPRGWSPGKLVLGLRIVNEDGEPPGLRWGIMRTAGTVFSEILYIGYLWSFWDKRKQTWHDKLAKTYVVRMEGVEPTLSPRWTRRS